MKELEELAMELVSAQERGDMEEWKKTAQRIANLEENQCACCHKSIVGLSEDKPELAVDVSIRGKIYTVCRECAKVIQWLDSMLVRKGDRE